jgi:sulfite exporter TauE/SafE
MGFTAVLAFGAGFGMLHALEADHLAAVAALAARDRSAASTVRQGIAWGIGHTLTLLAFGGAVLVLGASVDDRTAHWLEAAVGAMLVALGVDLLRRLLRAGTAATGAAQLPLRAVAVGMMHGLAGTAALVLLALERTGSPLDGAAYIAAFGLGSIAGMAVLSAAISMPLRASAARLAALNRGLQVAIALCSIALGAQVLYSNLG